MRHKPSHVLSIVIAILASAQLWSVHAQEKTAEGDFSERREIHRTYQLAPGANVDVSFIAGPVEVQTTNSSTAEVTVIESGQTRADLECYKTVVEQTATSLVISHEQYCSNVRDHQRVKLTLPRSVNLSLKMIAGSIQVGAIDGLLSLNSIAGQATIADVRAAEISSLARGLTIGVTQPAESGVRISSVIGGVDLHVAHGVNANLVVSSLRGELQNEVSDALVTKMGESDYRIVFGSGGKRISVSSIVGGVRLYR